MESYDNDNHNEYDTTTSTMTSIYIDTPDVADTSNVDDTSHMTVDDTSHMTVDDTSYVNGVTLSSDTELTSIYDIATNTIINMYNFLYAYSEYCVDHNMV
jgi:hypothetical protein